VQRVQELARLFGDFRHRLMLIGEGADDPTDRTVMGEDVRAMAAISYFPRKKSPPPSSIGGAVRERDARPVAQAWDRTVLRFCYCRSGRARPRRIYGVPRFGVTAGPPWEAPDPPPALVSSPAESADTSGWARVQHDQLGQVDGFQPEDHRGAGRLDQLDQAPQAVGAVGTQAVLVRRDQGVTGPNGRHLIYFVCRVISGEAAVVDREEVAAVEWCDFPTVLERWAGLKGGIYHPLREYLEQALGTGEPGGSAAHAT